MIQIMELVDKDFKRALTNILLIFKKILFYVSLTFCSLFFIRLDIQRVQRGSFPQILACSNCCTLITDYLGLNLPIHGKSLDN